MVGLRKSPPGQFQAGLAMGATGVRSNRPGDHEDWHLRSQIVKISVLRTAMCRPPAGQPPYSRPRCFAARSPAVERCLPLMRDPCSFAGATRHVQRLRRRGRQRAACRHGGRRPACAAQQLLQRSARHRPLGLCQGFQVRGRDRQGEGKFSWASGFTSVPSNGPRLHACITRQGDDEVAHAAVAPWRRRIR